ncbi:hypothetical protein GCM10009332_30340 [Shewanella gelidii]|uniref:Uncharacterized protein n=1 Tax=Shewanella gelidii TaxID=1642821 RepID=A0A917ND29_9GAMM|nr:hypothetical protein GCM10009332_30340 [Shewanella gelidii]
MVEKLTCVSHPTYNEYNKTCQIEYWGLYEKISQLVSKSECFKTAPNYARNINRGDASDLPFYFIEY